MRFWICEVTGPGGSDGDMLFYGATKRAAMQQLAKYCREWWACVSKYAAPEDDEAAIRGYFTHYPKAKIIYREGFAFPETKEAA